MNKTLVIHPKDSTTDFLSIIYKDKDWNVINSNVPPHQLKDQIIKHDRIIMLGHGLPHGLLGFGRLIINYEFVDLLRTKKDNVYIWCNANEFVENHNLHGFATGMIISEWEEAIYFGIIPFMNEIEQSNLLFAQSIKESIDNPANVMCEEVKKKYVLNESVIHNQIINYNYNNIFYYEDNSPK